jgi:HAD superfamily hydrolase (TIGR01509 family)
LFDVDGTLLDSAADICFAVQSVLQRRSPNHSSDEFVRSYIGRHLSELFTGAIPGITPPEIDALIDEYRAIYLSRGHVSTAVFPGVDAALSSLGGRKATATTKSTKTTRAVLERFGLLHYFDLIQGTDGFPAKPAPDVIRKSLDHFGVAPQDCLLVGDSTADMEAGLAAGVHVCAVRYGYGKHDEMARFRPDYWVDDLRELLS